MLHKLLTIVFFVGSTIRSESGVQPRGPVPLKRATTTQSIRSQPSPSQGLSVSEVALDVPSFNPSNGKKVTLKYQLSRTARVSIKIFDPDRQLVRNLSLNAPRKAGINREAWDGRDVVGSIVPNEAYFF